MRRFVYVFMAACLAASPAAHAGDQGWDRADAVSAFNVCYTETALGEIEAKCDFAKSCIAAAPENSTARGMNICASNAYGIWTEKMDAEYKAMLVKLKAHDADALTSMLGAHGAWLKYRDAECEARFNRSDFIGSAGGAIYKSCLSALTRDKALQYKSENMPNAARGY